MTQPTWLLLRCSPSACWLPPAAAPPGWRPPPAYSSLSLTACSGQLPPGGGWLEVSPALLPLCKKSRMVPLCPAAGWPPVLGRLAGTAMPPAAAGCLRGPFLFWPKPAGSAVCTVQGATPVRNRIGNLQPALRGDLQVHLRCAASSRCYVKLWQLEPKLGKPNQYAPCTFVQNVYVHDGSVSACRMRTCTMKLSTLWKAGQGAAPCSTPLRRWSRAHDGHTWDRCTAPLCRSSGSLQAAVACSWPA